MPLILGFVEILVGVLFLASGITDASFADVIKGKAGQAYRSGTTAAESGGSSSAPPAAAPGAGGLVNPVPGASTRGGRLDQGIDLTSPTFLAPFSGTVVASELHNAGWKNGGYVAIANALNPQDVWYFAEGLAPTVAVGDSVTAGQTIATPATNPYNGAMGNIELGPANPNDPLQPLAQVAHDPVAAVQAFYNRLLGLGVPTVQSVQQVGHA